MSSEISYPPEWVAQDKGQQILAICWSVVAISTLFASARLYVRAFMQPKDSKGPVEKKLHLDDYLIVSSVASVS